MDRKKCRQPEPYPELEPCNNHQQHDLAIIRPLYAGSNSELTAILQYVYQHTMLFKQCPEVAETLIGIAVAEMHHLELLAGAICALGGNPKYVNPQQKCWWNAGVVNYQQDLCRAMLANLKAETDAHSAYLAAAAQAKNPPLCALLRRIAADEKLHMEILTCIINSHCRKQQN